MHFKGAYLGMNCLLGAFLILFVFWLRYKKFDLMCPSILFALTILITYFITCLRFSLLISVYPIWFFALILALITLFWLGTITAHHITIPIKKKEVTYSKRTMRIVCMFFFLLIIISFLMTIHYLGAPPAISKNNRAEYFVSGWGTIIMLETVFFGVILFDYFNFKAVRKEFWIYVFTILVISFLLSNKFQLIYILILFLISYNTYRKKISIKQFVLVSILVIGLFAFLYEFIYRDMYGISQEMIYQGYKMNIPFNLKFIVQPYNYIAFNYENLFNYLISNTHSTYGLKTFGSILEIFHLDKLYPIGISNYLDEWKNLLVINSMTTGTMFEDFAQDGGITFMIIMTYFLGIVSQIAFDSFKVNKNFIYYFFYSVTTTSIFMSFFSNVFTSKMTVVNIVIALLINKLIKIKIVLR